jgi:hypothetical protein
MNDLRKKRRLYKIADIKAYNFRRLFLQVRRTQAVRKGRRAIINQ